MGSGHGSGSGRGWGRRVSRLVRDSAARHPLFASLLAAGLILRIVAQATYRPALFFFGDSFGYFAAAHNPVPSTHPVGYPLFLGALRPLHHVAAIPALQHLMGLATGVLIYLVLRRLGLPNRFAALGAAPVLLDAYQLHIESFIMAETLTQFLVATALLSLLWSRVPTIVTSLLAGGALGYAAISRTAALVVILPVLAFAVVRAFGAVRIVVLLLAFAAPVVLHTIWFQAVHDRYALSTNDGLFLYARVMPFADCGVVEERLKVLCDLRPEAERPESTWYIWNPDSPVRRYRPGDPQVNRNLMAGDFANQVIRHQPIEYATEIGSEFVRYFGLRRWGGPRGVQSGTWRFTTSHARPDDVAGTVRAYGDSADLRVVQPTARFLVGYQRVVTFPGAFFGILLLAPLVVARLDRGSRWPLAAFLFLAAAGLMLLLAPTMMVEFSNRFFLPPLPLLSAAAAIGAHRVATFISRRRSAEGGSDGESGAGRPEPQTEPASV